MSPQCPVRPSVCLSVTLVYCGQTLGWIKMKLDMQVGLGPGHSVLDGDPTPPPPKRHSPQFSTHICCGQMAGSIKMPLGSEVGLDPSDSVRWGPNSPYQKGGRAPPPVFGPCLLWPNGWMDQDGTWHEGRPRPIHSALDGDPARPAPIFGPCLVWQNGWMDALGMEVGLGPGHIVLDGNPAPPLQKVGTALPSNFRPMSVVAKRLDGSRYHLVRRQASAQATC